MWPTFPAGKCGKLATWVLGLLKWALTLLWGTQLLRCQRVLAGDHGHHRLPHHLRNVPHYFGAADARPCSWLTASLPPLSVQ